MTIQIFDPPLCCSTGVCGPSVDPELARFAADVAWLLRRGVEVERLNLAQQPTAYVDNEVVKAELARGGTGCLPLTLVDGDVVCRGKYPTREELAGYAGIAVDDSIVTDAVRELVAIGAAIASNCEPCFKHHYNEARKLGVTRDDMRLAVDTAQAVKESPARAVLALADKFLGDPISLATASPCCDGASDPAAGERCC